MTTATTLRPLRFAGVSVSAWAFGIRIWMAVVVALAASFWLELEAPSTAAITVAILAAPTRGQALEKACYRLLATLIGVTVAIAIVGLFSQARDLILAAFAAWLGLCVYAAGLLDGNRAYAAVLSGYTVALIAIQQMDTPQHVFESGVARGAAIAVGIIALAVVNDLLAAPDNHPQLTLQLATLHRRVRDYAKAIIRDEATDSATAAGLLPAGRPRRGDDRPRREAAVCDESGHWVISMTVPTDSRSRVSSEVEPRRRNPERHSVRRGGVHRVRPVRPKDTIRR